MSSFVNDTFPAIVINKNYPLERKRFTLLHELGHLLLNISDHFSAKEEEKICDCFAGAVLLPQKIVYSMVGQMRKNISLIELMIFRSNLALAFRLFCIGLLI
ncbi:MAG: ImmA/IrrE family metallo-endopeptidase [Bacteroidales bacterium]|nr:ImmA/IrrE family metallo-endopeptidase [Bacteroidales bacterium]